MLDLGISQEQAKKKSNKLPDGESEMVNRLKLENKKLKSTQVRVWGWGQRGQQFQEV